ncbi:PEGA domain-containing protein [Persicimonas caeni]|uniref:PEGA domain-containing protein n=1 Tax=Persicimonas caeni TaxID=2292766 RepID=A0A4Y6Q288_PERCE|nr:serine/threonine-protein kinase [Persicimonas caeni]QDG54652.1 PEGA domain-containing protein [Persicimonas caeni]QED35873.1 protein kinase [Persicimonas caeni]
MVESAESFGKYTLLEKIAVGGMAEIYRAKTVGLGGFEKLLAIKRLHPQFGDEHDVTKMLVDEARIAVQLTHPNIAQIFDLGCIDEQYFIAMEFIDGVDLHQLNKRQRERGRAIPEPAVVFAMAEALGGLHFAHTRKGPDGSPLQIVHRDVSPQNIMISHEGEVKLVDFGIAKADVRAQEDTQHGIIKGKFYYMSPEQAHGHHIDARTDVFAAGMVLYELLAGDNPYARIQEYELLKAVRRADFPSISAVVPQIDPELANIVSKATQRDANYRFQSAQEMQLALMQYLDRRHGPYRRMKLAEVIGDAGSNPWDSAEDSALMSRLDYEANEASVIFEPGTPLSSEIDTGATDEFSDNPFDEDEPTQLWTPGAPTPAESGQRRDEAPAKGQGGLSAPQFMDLSGFGSGNVPAPKGATTATKLPLHERVLPGWLTRTHLVFGGIAMMVTVLAGVLAFVLIDEEPSADPPKAHAKSEGGPQAAVAPADNTGTVDVRVTSTPRGAKVELDGESMGFTPTVLEGISTAETYDLKLSMEGFEAVERTIQPNRETTQLEFELPSGGAVLKVATYPPDARIEVDGKEIGKSPVDVPGLSRNDTHQIVATLEDGRTTTRKVAWESDDGRVKQIELRFDTKEEAREEPQVEERAEKATTSRKARRRPKRRTTSRRRKRSEPSKAANLDIWGDSNETEESSSTSAKSPQKLDIWGNGDNDAAKKGHLSVRISGKGKVYVDGRLIADNTSSVKHSLEPGTYGVRVYFTRLKRYSATKQLRVRSGKTTTASFSP